METFKIMKIPNRYRKSLNSCYKTVYTSNNSTNDSGGIG